MVNVPGRSKGCSTCRRRKIKCDVLFPECTQCIRTGVKCPGARVGPFFVHALASRPSGQSVESMSSTNIGLRARSRHNEEAVVKFNLYTSSAFHLQQPGRTEIFDQHFVSHFIDSFGFKSLTSGGQPPIWLSELAVFATSPRPTLIQFSTRAASMFFYGAFTKDVSIQTEARRWYSRALQSLQRLLARRISSYSGEDACAVVMLTHFESLAGTSKDAWFQHIQAAAAMLETRGPRGCVDGFSHRLFRHLRLLVFAASIFKNTDHVFSSWQWKTIPFEIHPKGSFDQLVDILFSSLSCLTLAKRLTEFGDDETHLLTTELRTSVRSTILELHSWWAQCMIMMNISAFNTGMPAGDEDLALRPDHFPLLPQPDMPTAALGALYDAATIVVFRLLFLVSPSARRYEPRIRQHAQSILSAMNLMWTIPGPMSSRGSMMIGPPSRILQVWCPPTLTDFRASFAASDELFADVAAFIFSKYEAESSPCDFSQGLLWDETLEEGDSTS